MCFGKRFSVNCFPSIRHILFRIFIHIHIIILSVFYSIVLYIWTQCPYINTKSHNKHWNEDTYYNNHNAFWFSEKLTYSEYFYKAFALYVRFTVFMIFLLVSHKWKCCSWKLPVYHYNIYYYAYNRWNNKSVNEQINRVNYIKFRKRKIIVAVLCLHSDPKTAEAYYRTYCACYKSYYSRQCNVINKQALFLHTQSIKRAYNTWFSLYLMWYKNWNNICKQCNYNYSGSKRHWFVCLNIIWCCRYFLIILSFSKWLKIINIYLEIFIKETFRLLFKVINAFS